MSLDLNLFFLRIMKEHSFFLEIGFGPKDSNLACAAQDFRNSFENLLSTAVDLADGNVSHKALESEQFATQYTVDAEKLTNFYTGIPFNTGLTSRELILTSDCRCETAIEHKVDILNRDAYRLTASLAEFKDKLLHNVIACKLFTFNYPLLIEHILREAKMYMAMLECLMNRRNILGSGSLINQEVFWNRQMAEHAKFIAGLLDPTEETLIDAARMFGKEFDKLTIESKKATQRTFDITGVTSDSISAMKRLRDFKIAGTEGLLDCKIKSIIIPLLADHVLREANHYLCVLGVCGFNHNVC